MYTYTCSSLLIHVVWVTTLQNAAGKKSGSEKKNSIKKALSQAPFPPNTLSQSNAVRCEISMVYMVSMVRASEERVKKKNKGSRSQNRRTVSPGPSALGSPYLFSLLSLLITQGRLLDKFTMNYWRSHVVTETTWLVSSDLLSLYVLLATLPAALHAGGLLRALSSPRRQVGKSCRCATYHGRLVDILHISKKQISASSSVCARRRSLAPAAASREAVTRPLMLARGRFSAKPADGAEPFG
jgi:hypothetical protein